MVMKIGFIGLGNVGGKLSASLLRNGLDVTVNELDKSIAAEILAKGAKWADSPKQLAEQVDFIITCLPSPTVSAAVVEGDNGILAGHRRGQNLDGNEHHRCG